MVSGYSAFINNFYFYDIDNDRCRFVWNIGTCDVKKNELKKKYGIKIDYLELRNIKNLKLTNTIKNAKIFVAYFINKVRLIDNF